MRSWPEPREHHEAVVDPRTKTILWRIRSSKISRSRTSRSLGQSESLGNHMRQPQAPLFMSCFRLNDNNDLPDMLLLEAQLTAVKVAVVAVW